MLIRRLLILLMIVLMTGTGLVYAQTDTDGDGLPDNVDQCPREPGPRENGGCPYATPVPDSDNDGLPDTVDNCPNEPGTRENGGCPTTQPQPTAPAPNDSDSDGDGLNDNEDRCPREAGNRNNGGCPAAVATLIPMPTTGRCVGASAQNDNINIRREPSTKSDVIGVLPVNNLIIIIGSFMEVAAVDTASPVEAPEVWYQVEHEDGAGWILADLLRTGGECANVPFPEMTVEEDGEEPVALKIKMTDLLVSSISVGGSGAEFPTVPPVVFDVETSSWVFDEEDVMIIIIGMPTDQKVMFCKKSAEGFNPSECMVLGARAKADILVESFCEAGADGALTCGIPDSCATDGDVTTCDTDTETAAVCTKEKGKWVCPTDQLPVLQPFESESAIPGVIIIKPGDGSVRIGLLLPAVQKVREAAN